MSAHTMRVGKCSRMQAMLQGGWSVLVRQGGLPHLEETGPCTQGSASWGFSHVTGFCVLVVALVVARPRTE